MHAQSQPLQCPEYLSVSLTEKTQKAKVQCRKQPYFIKITHLQDVLYAPRTEIGQKGIV